MKITYRVAMENASHEALVRQLYKDSVGVDTWSFGLTNATGHTVQRYRGKPASIQQCCDVYAWALDRYANAVRDVFKDRPLNEHQLAAALSFCWNLGAGALRRASWVRHFKAGRMAEAEAAWKTWNRAGGRVLAGLVKRRSMECDLFFRGKWSHAGTVVEYTRLNANLTVVWGSAIRTNVEREMRQAIGRLDGTGDRTGVQQDVVSQPDKEPFEPTLTPDQDRLSVDPNEPAPTSGRNAILAIIAAIGAAVAAYFGAR